MWLVYSRRLVRLPQPHFVVFYNGTQPAPDHEVLKLSDAFEGSGDAPKGEGKPLALELLADVYNINAGHNGAIQEACQAIKGYADFVSKVRKNQHSQANAYEFPFECKHSNGNSHPFFILSALSILPVATCGGSKQSGG